MLSFKEILLGILNVILKIGEEKKIVNAIVKTEQELHTTLKVGCYLVVGLGVFFFACIIELMLK